MKTIKTKFSGRTTLVLLAINWVTMIVLTCFYLGEKNTVSMSIIGTLIVGFALQLGFICDQCNRKIN